MGLMKIKHPEVNQETVDAIVDIATSKCFDWAQGSIAETMAAVAADLTIKAVDIKHEVIQED